MDVIFIWNFHGFVTWKSGERGEELHILENHVMSFMEAPSFEWQKILNHLELNLENSENLNSAWKQGKVVENFDNFPSNYSNFLTIKTSINFPFKL